MSASVRWDGFDSFLQELKAIPANLRAEGLTIVHDEATGAAVEIVQRYGRKTGRLAQRVRVEVPNSDLLIATVKSQAPHSHLYEFGTQRRQTGKGYNRGRMPAANPPVVVPIAQKRRRRMRRRLVEMLRRHGFQVGDA